MDLLYGADESGRPGSEHVAEPRRRAPWRRPGVGPWLVRSRNEALHLRHRQSDAGLHGRRPARRQPLHRFARRRERRHRQDGLVLPDGAARHARLGLVADADPHRRHHQRQAAQARVHRRAQRLLLHGRSCHRRPRRDGQVRNVRQRLHRPPPVGLTRTRPEQGSDRSRARWSRRSRAASPTGSRRRSLRTPGSSTSTSRTASTCSISPNAIRADRWAWVASCAYRWATSKTS